MGSTQHTEADVSGLYLEGDFHTCKGCESQRLPEKCTTCRATLCEECLEQHECKHCEVCNELLVWEELQEIGFCLEHAPCTEEDHEFSSHESWARNTHSHREWRDAGIEIAECTECGSTLAWPLEVIEVAA